MSVTVNITGYAYTQTPFPDLSARQPWQVALVEAVSTARPTVAY